MLHSTRACPNPINPLFQASEVQGRGGLAHGSPCHMFALEVAHADHQLSPSIQVAEMDPSSDPGHGEGTPARDFNGYRMPARILVHALPLGKILDEDGRLGSQDQTNAYPQGAQANPLHPRPSRVQFRFQIRVRWNPIYAGNSSPDTGPRTKAMKSISSAPQTARRAGKPGPLDYIWDSQVKDSAPCSSH